METGPLSPVSNRATWKVLYELSNDDGPVDLSDVDQIQIDIRDRASCSSLLSVTKTGGGVTIVDTGVFEWAFSASQMRTLSAKTYDVGCTITKDDEVVQLFIGTLPVIDGVVS